MKNIYIYILILISTCISTYASDIYVSSSSISANPDGTQTKPFPQLYSALAVANENDVIHIAQGKYLPETNIISGIRYSTFTCNKNISIIGGYSMDFLLKNPILYPTILSGDMDLNDTYNINGVASNNDNNTYHVISVNTGITLSMEGVIIQGGNSTGATVTNGAGILGLGQLKLENVIITGNYATGKGAGIEAEYGINANKVSILGNVNTSDGAGINVTAGLINLTNSILKANSGNSGSALFIGGTITSAYISNCSFLNNTAGRYGNLAIYNTSNSNKVVLVNNTFVGNTAIVNNTYAGSGIYVNWSNSGNIYLINNTILGNITSADASDKGNRGGAVYCRRGKLYLANNFISGNYVPAGVGAGADIHLLMTDGPTINSLGYNVYNAYAASGTGTGVYNTNSNDIILGVDKIAELNLLSKVFEGSATTDVFNAITNDNGGATPTVKIIGGSEILAYGKTITNLPATQLSETTLDVDLNNDGDKLDYLNIDQRGISRNLSGNASIGAYEYVPDVPTNIENTALQNKIILIDKELHINATNFICSVYDISGKKQIEKTSTGFNNVINISLLSKGVYLIRLVTDNKEEIKKIIL